MKENRYQKEFDALYRKVRSALHLSSHTMINIKGEILIEIMELDRWDNIVKTVIKVNRNNVEDGYRIAISDLEHYIQRKDEEFYSYITGKESNNGRRKKGNTGRRGSAVRELQILWADSSD